MFKSFGDFLFGFVTAFILVILLFLVSDKDIVREKIIQCFNNKQWCYYEYTIDPKKDLTMKMENE